MRKTFPAHKTALHRVKSAKTPVLIGEFEVRVTQKAGALMREIKSDPSREPIGVRHAGGLAEG